MLMIRLSRVGKKKYPTYRILIQEKSRDPWGKALEILGNYNPHTKDFVCQADRIKYWLSVGAQMSATVNNLLIRHGVITGKKMKAAKLNQKKKNKEKEEKEKKEEKNEAQPAAEEKQPAENKTEPKDEPQEENKGKAQEENKPETSATDKKDGNQEEK